MESTEEQLFESDFCNWELLAIPKSSSAEYDAAPGLYFSDLCSSPSEEATEVVLRYVQFALERSKTRSEYIYFATAGFVEDYVNAIVRQNDVARARKLYKNSEFRQLLESRMIWGESDSFCKMLNVKKTL